LQTELSGSELISLKKRHLSHDNEIGVTKPAINCVNTTLRMIVGSLIISLCRFLSQLD
jgi:hypothetical protein